MAFIVTTDHAEQQREREGVDAVQTVDDRDHADNAQGEAGRDGGHQRTGKALVDGQVDQLGQAHLLLAVQGAVLADTVIDNDGIVDGVAQDGQQGSNKVAVQGNAQEDKDAEDDEHVVQQSHNGGRTGLEAADLAEAVGYIMELN